MAEVNLKGKEKTLYSEVPNKLTDTEVLFHLKSHEVNWRYIRAIKKVISFNDEILSNWFNVSVKTFRSYKETDHNFKENIKEQTVLLLALIKHGLIVFEKREAFETWLTKPNFFFDNQSPISFLNTVSGIRFVDDRLTAFEYGDNV